MSEPASEARSEPQASEGGQASSARRYPSRYDVAIIGGGVIGVASADLLAARGARVVLLERGEVASGASYGNAGWISPSHGTPLPAPGVIRQALRWLFDPESPFYVKPRLDMALARWLLGFLRASTAARARVDPAREPRADPGEPRALREARGRAGARLQLRAPRPRRRVRVARRPRQGAPRARADHRARRLGPRARRRRAARPRAPRRARSARGRVVPAGRAPGSGAARARARGARRRARRTARDRPRGARVRARGPAHRADRHDARRLQRRPGRARRRRLLARARRAARPARAGAGRQGLQRHGALARRTSRTCPSCSRRRRSP